MNYLSILPLLFVKQTKKRQVYSDSLRFYQGCGAARLLGGSGAGSKFLRLRLRNPGFYHFGVRQFIEFHICYVALSSLISLSTVILGIPVCLGDANK